MSNAEPALLRPNQIREYEEMKDSLQKNLGKKDIQDKAAVRGQLRRLERSLEVQRPVAPVGPEKDKLARETDELLDKILVGMPSQAEMRCCPPGAIDKHRSWEKRNKDRIQRWKNNRLRLFAGSDSLDIANLEMFRPTRNTLNMDNSFIKGQDFNLPEVVGHCSPYTDNEIALIKQRAPEEVWSKLPILTAEQRSLVRQIYVETWEDDQSAAVEEPAEDDLDEIVEQALEEAPPEHRFDVTQESTSSLEVDSDLWGGSAPKNDPPRATKGRAKTRRR